MAAYSTTALASGNTLTITAHAVIGLDLKPYVEYRLEERDSTGAWLGYCAMGSQTFVENALRHRISSDITENER